MSEETEKHQAEDHEFAEVEYTGEELGGHTLNFDDLSPVPLHVSADLGKTGMLVRDILDLKVGSIVSLDKMAGEMTDVYVNGLHIARGEVVVIADALHIRLAEIIGVNELQNG